MSITGVASGQAYPCDVIFPYRDAGMSRPKGGTNTTGAALKVTLIACLAVLGFVAACTQGEAPQAPSLEPGSPRYTTPVIQTARTTAPETTSAHIPTDTPTPTPTTARLRISTRRPIPKTVKQEGIQDLLRDRSRTLLQEVIVSGVVKTGAQAGIDYCAEGLYLTDDTGSLLLRKNRVMVDDRVVDRGVMVDDQSLVGKNVEVTGRYPVQDYFWRR